MDWTTADAARLITRCEALDPRLRFGDGREAAGFYETWARILNTNGIPLESLMRVRGWIEDYYGTDPPPRQRVTPGVVVNKWKARQRSQHRDPEPVAVGIGSVFGTPMPTWFREVSEWSHGRWMALREEFKGGPIPQHRQDALQAEIDEFIAQRRAEPAPRVVTARERRERHCQREAIECHDDIKVPCLCDHTTCYGGFLDEDTTHDPHDRGREYVATVRCPTCYDAVMMRDERI